MINTIEDYPLLVSLSGGETSGTMAYLLKQKYSGGNRRVVFVYANTGKEREKTLVFIDKMDKAWGLNVVWIEAVPSKVKGKGTDFKIVDFKSASRHGEPFEEVIKRYGIPNKTYPHCSRELKTVPILKYARSLGWHKYETAIGIRGDETRRIKDMKSAMSKGKIYPLITEWPSKKETIKNWWAKQPFQLGLKSWEGNCDACWKKSLRKLLTLIDEGPEIMDWWNEMEIKYSHHTPIRSSKGGEGGEPPFYFFRESRSAIDLLELARQPFSKMVDEANLQSIMFFDPELDVTDGCAESCEAF